MLYNLCNNNKIAYVPIAQGLCNTGGVSPQVFTNINISDIVNNTCLSSKHLDQSYIYHSKHLFEYILLLPTHLHTRPTNYKIIITKYNIVYWE